MFVLQTNQSILQNILPNYKLPYFAFPISFVKFQQIDLKIS